MNKESRKAALIWTAVLIVLLILLPFLVPSAMRVAGAEGDIVYTNLPEYEPVELAHPDAGPAEFSYDRWGNPIASYSPHRDGIQADGMGYRDETLYVRMEWCNITNSKGVDTPVLFTYVQIADPSQMRTAFSGQYGATTEKQVHLIAKYCNAVLAIDADWCESRPDGWVVRNGVQYRKKSYNRWTATPPMTMDALIIDENGDFHIYEHPELEDLAIYEGRVMHSLVLGPALVIDGEPVFHEGNNYGTGDRMWLEKETQRQVLCQMGPLSYLIITTEGEDSLSMGGFTGNEIAQIAHDAGALQAYNLDGGASAQTVLVTGIETAWDGTEAFVYERINDPTIPYRRPVCDILYFCTAEREKIHN